MDRWLQSVLPVALVSALKVLMPCDVLMKLLADIGYLPRIEFHLALWYKIQQGSYI